jgi:hypothetical protein
MIKKVLWSVAVLIAVSVVGLAVGGQEALAVKAGARSLARTHIIQPPGKGLKRRVLEFHFLKDVDKVYKGAVQFAQHAHRPGSGRKAMNAGRRSSTTSFE